MKFVIEQISKRSGRLGYLALRETEEAGTGKQFKTPVLLQTTKSGSIPYLSRDVFDYVSKDMHVLQMSAATMDHMAESVAHFKQGLSAFVGYKGYPTFLTVRDPCALMPSGYNDKDMVPLFTRRGKETLSAKRYMDMVESLVPDIYQGLSDADTNADSAKKRVQKSVDRTEQFMEYCYERQRKSEKLKDATLFAPIVGGYNTYARSQSIKHCKAHAETVDCGGYLLEGFHNYGLSATAVDCEQLLAIMLHCVGELDASKPRMMLGAYTPPVTLELVRLGVDMFDSSYAYCAAINYKALSFKFELNAPDATANASSNDDVLTETPFIDLTNDCLKEDFTPLLRNCQCLACRQHTRAYIHHLYKTQELLGPILLMIHNLHHYMNFFMAIRATIVNDSLPELLELIKFQATDTAIDYQVYENTKAIGRVGLGKGLIKDN